MKPPNRTAVLVMVAVLIYASVALCATFNLRTSPFVFMTLNFITFVMAFVALGRRGK